MFPLIQSKISKAILGLATPVRDCTFLQLKTHIRNNIELLTEGTLVEVCRSIVKTEEQPPTHALYLPQKEYHIVKHDIFSRIEKGAVVLSSIIEHEHSKDLLAQYQIRARKGSKNVAYFATEDIIVNDVKTKVFVLDEESFFKLEEVPVKEQSHLRGRLGECYTAYHKIKNFLEQFSMLIEGIMDVFYLMEDFLWTQEEVFELLIHTLELGYNGKLDKWFKYNATVLFCRANPLSDLPINPKINDDRPGYIAGGRIYRFLRNRLNRRDESSCGFFYSLMDCKRSFPPLDGFRQIETVLKHKECLTGRSYYRNLDNMIREDPQVDYDHRMTHLVNCIKEVVTHTFRKAKVSRSFSNENGWDEPIVFPSPHGKDKKKVSEYSSRVPTTSSCFEARQKDGGNLGYMFSLTSSAFAHDLYSMIQPTKKRQPYTVYCSWDEVSFVESLVSQLHITKKLCNMSIIEIDYLTHTLRTNCSFRKYRNNPMVLNAIVNTIAEPMKFRIVTSGECAAYSAARPIQKELWKELSSKKEFTLTGKTLDAEYLKSRYLDPLFYKCSKEDPFYYIAGDYESATDNLFAMLRDVAWEAICHRKGYYSRFLEVPIEAELEVVDMDRDGEDGGGEDGYNVTEVVGATCSAAHLSWAEIGSATLGKHMIQSSFLEDYTSTNGQLMGSPLSFIILCIVNAAICYSACTYSHMRDMDAAGHHVNYTYEEFVNEFALVINGDDLSVRVPKSEFATYYDEWSKQAICAGMSPSVGKNFVSTEMVLVNSCPYWIVENGNGTSDFHLVPRVNPGLIRGQGKVLFDTRIDLEPEELDEILLSKRDQLECVQAYAVGTNRVEEINDLFLFYNKSLLMKSTRSWRMPAGLGGLGLPFGKISEAAKCYANGVIAGLYRPETIATPGFGMKVARDRMERILRQYYCKEQFIEDKWFPQRDNIFSIDESFLFNDNCIDLLNSIPFDYQVIELTDLLPMFMTPDMEEKRTYKRFNSDVKDALSHPYLRKERDWDAMRGNYHVKGHLRARLQKH